MESWSFVLLAIGLIIVCFYTHSYFKVKSNRLMLLSSYFIILREYGYSGDENLNNYAYLFKVYSSKLAKRLHHDSYKKYIPYIDGISHENINESTFKSLYYFSHCMIVDAILNIYAYCNEPSQLDGRYSRLFEISIKKLDISDEMYDSYKEIGLQEIRDRIEKVLQSL